MYAAVCLLQSKLDILNLASRILITDMPSSRGQPSRERHDTTIFKSVLLSFWTIGDIK
jgi:hypothetical protein